MNRQTRRRILAALVLLDALGITLALVMAYWLRIASGLLPERAFEEFAVYLKVGLLIIPIWLLIFALNHLYELRAVLGGIDEYVQIAKSNLFAVVAIIMLGYWVRIATLSRGWLVIAWVLAMLFVGLFRFLFRRYIYRLRQRGRLRTRTLIVGANEQGKAIARQFHAAGSAGVEIVGFIDDFLPPGTPVALDDQPPRADTLRVLGGPDRLHQVAQSLDVRQVVVVTNAVAWETFQELMAELNVNAGRAPYEIKLSPGFYEILTTGVQVTHDANVPLLLVNRQRITGVDKLLKASLDYLLAIVNMIIALPLMGLILAALRISTRGPVIDRHLVLACGGGTFTTWKFHTGLVDTPRPGFAHPLTGGDSSGGALVSAEQITRLQHFLYNTGLDKMPQLVNILTGQMSWVGPRTVSVGQAEVHSPWLPNLLTVKPGITGPWAVVDEHSLDEEMRLTMYYIRNWTIWMDMQILLQTAQRILRLERGKARLPER
ncbi:MAG: sugar transferase [Caldilineae bacterium]|nr:sugar transferase [Anaerolineae bacterium]MCB0204872.1 sugar transferase [Anaerolineae bacterium]MCB9154782.1 sugar transferase [Caldilineae bacterium]